VDSVRQGWDLQLTEYDAERWRATFFVAGQAHSIRRRLGVGVDAVASDAARGVGDVDEVRALAHSFDSGLAAMQERERRCSHVRAELASVERQASVRRDAGDVERALAVMREALTDWQGMLKQETGPARRSMQALLKGRLAFTPQEFDGERFYTFEGEGTISPVIAGTAGLQRVWWPQRDTFELT
jgi:hypothetical protein